MNKVKVAYICHLSSPKIRERLHLKSLFWGNVMRKMVSIKPLEYEDTGLWNETFIKAFEDNYAYDCSVVTNFLGLKRDEQRFQINGVHYIFIKEKEHLLGKIFKRIFRVKPKEDYSLMSEKIHRTVCEINPDIVVLCGAENAVYASSVLLIQDKPIFVILQTLLNLPKRIQMGVGNSFRRELENRIFSYANYYGTDKKEEADYIAGVNHSALCLNFSFPSIASDVIVTSKKEYDFVFFANELTRNKGVDDVLIGFGMVRRKYPKVKLIVIGTCQEEYYEHLLEIIDKYNIRNNVKFCGHYPLKSDMLQQVMKAKISVLPGITAPMNSTVRESMFLGIPIVMYETSATRIVNHTSQSILTAEMENHEDLGNKMLYAYEHPVEMDGMALRAKEYAEANYSPKAVTEKLCSNVLAIVDHYYKGIAIPNELLLV